MSYNGYRNYHTWNVALWVSNDEPMYRAAQRHGRFNRESAKRFIKSIMPRGTPDKKDPKFTGVDWSSISRVLNDLRGGNNPRRKRVRRNKRRSRRAR